MNKYIKEAEACASLCFTKHLKMLPHLASKIVDTLSSRKLQ